MAINNWRYVVTWGYMDENGNIVEERQYVPETTTTTTTVAPWTNVPQTNVAQPINGTATSSNYFSPAEAYRLQAQWYYSNWNKNLWDAYNALWSWSDAFSNTANQLNQFYNQLAADVSQREQGLASAKYDLANQLTNDLLSQRQYVMDTFGPQGTLTQEINKYYDDLWNYLATDAWRQAANIAAQWVHSWASLWAIRAQQNEAYNESFGRYVQAKEQEINAKQQIASNLINYMSALRQEYWDTTNQYIISQYQRANDMLNSLSQNIASSNMELANAKLSASLSRGSGSSQWNSVYDYMVQNAENQQNTTTQQDDWQSVVVS